MTYLFKGQGFLRLVSPVQIPYPARKWSVPSSKGEKGAEEGKPAPSIEPEAEDLNQGTSGISSQRQSKKLAYLVFCLTVMVKNKTMP